MKRCCETCRFFEKGTLAGSGWCRHPERLEAQSDLVLVRASQLTCRKGWDKDFWEPIARNGRTVDRIPRGAQLGPVPPASPDDIDAIIKAGKASDERAAASAEFEEDRVVGAAPSPLTHVPKSLITKHLPPSPEQAQPATSAEEGQNSREKILIAKEEVARKRISNRIRPSVEPLPSAAASPSPPTPPASESAVSSEPVDSVGSEPENAPENVVDPVVDDNTVAIDDVHTPGQDGRQVLPFDTRPSEIDWDDEPLVPSIPPTFDHWNYPTDRHAPFLWLVQGVNSKRAEETPPVDSESAATGDAVSEDVVARHNTPTDEQPFELPPPVDATFQPPARPGREKPRARRHRQTFSFRTRWVDARERPGRQPSAPSAWAETPQWADEPAWSEESAWTEEALPDEAVLPALDAREAGVPLVHVEAPPRRDPIVPLSGDWVEPDAHGWTEQTSDIAPVANLDAGIDREIYRTATEWSAQSVASDGDTDDVVVGSNGVPPIVYDPEIDEYVLAPDVPRMCRTCAAFRPAEDGERGWCSNGWAFDNRLLVSAWDVPCQTSFGNWWIPNDDHWNDGILERLYAPAPLFDLLMAQRTPQRREKPNPKKRWS